MSSRFYGLCGHCCMPLKAPRRGDFCRECNRKSMMQRIREDIKDSKILPERDRDEGFDGVRKASVAVRCKVIQDNGTITIHLISLFGGRNQVKRVVNHLIGEDFDAAKKIAIAASKKIKFMRASDAFDWGVSQFLGEE